MQLFEPLQHLFELEELFVFQLQTWPKRNQLQLFGQPVEQQL